MNTSDVLLKPARIEWRDGQPFNLDAGDWYFSTGGGLAETDHVFISGNDLPQRWEQAPRIGELGFGTGLNFLATVRRWLQARCSGWLHYTAVEHAPLSPANHARALAHWPELGALADTLLRQMPAPRRGFHLLVFPQWKVRLLLLLDTAAAALPQLDGTIDAWYLDGFAPTRNPDLWSDAIWHELRRLSRAGTTFATYSAAGHVRRSLQAHGFSIQKRPGFGRKREMLSGRLAAGESESALPPWFASPPPRRPQAATIVGAGLTGCALARALADADVAVQVLDTHAHAAAGASGMPAMLARPYPEKQSSPTAALYSQAAAFALRTLDGAPGWTPTPIALDGGAVNGAIVEPAALCAHWLEHPLIRFRPSTPVTALRQARQGWDLRTPAGELGAETVVLATATAALADSLPPTTAVRGQLAHWPGLPAPPQPRCDRGHVLPWNGGLLAGATYRRDSADTAPGMDDTLELVEIARRLQPNADINPHDADAYVGIRQATADRLPMLGAVPDAKAWRTLYAELHHGRRPAAYPPGPALPGLWCSLGHGSRGATLAALQAETLAACILDWPRPLPADLLAALHPGRFLIRELKRPLGSRPLQS